MTEQLAQRESELSTYLTMLGVDPETYLVLVDADLSRKGVRKAIDMLLSRQWSVERLAREIKRRDQRFRRKKRSK